MEIKLTTVLIVFLVIIFLDKGLTIFNIIKVNQNYSEAMGNDYFKVEQNPMAKWFFIQFGLWWGTFLYSIVTLITLFMVYAILSFAFSNRVALYVIMIAYGFVIFNNIFFAMKYSQVIP